MSRLLVVEDEAGIAFALEADLRAEGYDVVVAATGDEAMRTVRAGSFDLVLLDVMLPGKDGFDVCREMRRSGLRAPIIMLTAKAHEAEKVMGLELGADDYITKPFSPRELRARVKAALRRAGSESPDVFRFGNTEVDFARCEVRRGSDTIDLSALEFKLLTAFVRSRGRVLTREQLLDAAWGRDVSLNDRVVDNHIVSLRRKIEPDPERPQFLVNIRGLGYRFDA
ncbi:MAG: response regulator transcription factor [Acidobacteria bacterium]|nr:response regulator transcription factor [Acidobacteriota bacterium]